MIEPRHTYADVAATLKRVGLRAKGITTSTTGVTVTLTHDEWETARSLLIRGSSVYVPTIEEGGE